MTELDDPTRLHANNSHSILSSQKEPVICAYESTKVPYTVVSVSLKVRNPFCLPNGSYRPTIYTPLNSLGRHNLLNLSYQDFENLPCMCLTFQVDERFQNLKRPFLRFISLDSEIRNLTFNNFV